MTFLYTVLPAELARTRALERKYTSGKPIRKLTIEDMGGPDRHRISESPLPECVIKGTKDQQQARARQELGRNIVQFLRENGPTRSAELAAQFNCNVSRISAAVRDLVTVKSGIAVGETQKTYWIMK